MEIIDLYNNKREKLEKTWIREQGEPEEGEYKLSVHIWILNSNGELLIQKRKDDLKRNPGKWAYTGGAVGAGETSLHAALRETKEEMGIEVSKEKIEYLLSFKREHGFVDVWLVKDDINLDDLQLQESEVSDAKWVNIKELEQLMNDGKFVKALEVYYEMLAKLLVKVTR